MWNEFFNSSLSPQSSLTYLYAVDSKYLQTSRLQKTKYHYHLAQMTHYHMVNTKKQDNYKVLLFVIKSVDCELYKIIVALN